MIFQSGKGGTWKVKVRECIKIEDEEDSDGIGSG
jgi:hypothetical protein